MRHSSDVRRDSEIQLSFCAAQFESLQLYSIHFNLIKQSFTDTRNLTAFMLGMNNTVIKTLHSLPSRSFPFIGLLLIAMTIVGHITELT